MFHRYEDSSTCDSIDRDLVFHDWIKEVFRWLKRFANTFQMNAIIELRPVASFGFEIDLIEDLRYSVRLIEIKLLV